MITIEKCPCNNPRCQDYHLAGIGKFVQGSGFSYEEATFIAKSLNESNYRTIDGLTYSNPVPVVAQENSNYDDVYAFHGKYELLAGTKPQKLTQRKLKERCEFLWEEFTEFMAGAGFAIRTESHTLGLSHTDPDKKHSFLFGAKNELQFFQCDDAEMDEMADALIDLVYVAMGTAVMMGLPWQQLWDDVQRANMSKVRGTTHRGHTVDVSKPPGWVGPKTMEILTKYGFNPQSEEVDDE